MARRVSIILNRHLVPLCERCPGASGLPPPHPVVFIVGPPRCGSTFIMQLIAGGLDVAYFSNRHEWWFGAPHLVDRLHPAPRPGSDAGELRSRHGVTTGAGGPSECGEWWYRFFPRTPHQMDHDHVGLVDLGGFRRSLALCSTAARRPLVIKNLYASLRIPPILEAVPDARFIRIRREEGAVVDSILAVRRERLGSESAWWSMRPNGWESMLGRPGREQVRFQVRAIERAIDAGLEAAAVPADRVLEIHYERCREAPEEALASVGAFLRRSSTDRSATRGGAGSEP